MTSMEMSGRICRTLSTLPRLCSFVTSVTQALKAASLAVLPKKVITQSSTTMLTAAAATAFTPGNRRAAFSFVT